MAAISTPVPANTPLGDNAAPGGALRSFTTPTDTAGVPISPATQATLAAVLAAALGIGTRRYGTPLAPVAVGTGDAVASAITAGTTEVLVHNVGTERAFLAYNAAATVNGIPLAADEKFHMRVTTGDVLHVIGAAAGGRVNIVPVV